ncbi:MAG: DUF3786 domain-containing protein [Phycisphaerales bacterium]|nr:MAG: DUF3786 domain-containing protein [Phycisphaerales bacterium]
MAHEGLWEQLEKLDGPETADRVDCRYLSDPPCYIVTLLNDEYVVDLPKREIFPSPADSEEQPAGFIEQLCILAYLITAQDIPLGGKLVRGETFPGGQFFFRGVHCLPTDKLEEAFGDNPEDLCRVSEKFDAKPREFGDASFELYLLPRVPVTMVVWGRDDEFDARASILFDQTAAEHMPLDALLAGVNLVVDSLIEESKRSD